MHIAGHPYPIMSQSEVELLYQAALRILEEMGMEIQNESLLQKLAGAGLPVDFGAERVRFPARFVETFIAGAEKYDWDHALPTVTASAGVYHSLVHDPETGKLIPWNEENLAFYFELARSLPHVGRASMLGYRLPVPGFLEPLYERYYCWKYGAEEGGSIYLDEVCPYLLELYEALASYKDQPLEQVFRATVYLVPALKLGRHEATQVMYFHERGLRVGIGGGMLTMGATAPVTLAGAVALNLAEQLALGLLEWVLWGTKRLSIGSSIAAMDMRTTIRPFGRPEMAFANLMTAQVARWLEASFAGHAGLSDAKLPSVEAGAQKALSAIPTLLAGGSVWLDAGLLGIDQVCSPIQLILDNEFLSALERFTHEFQLSPETVGIETILKAGPGGNYLADGHTALHFRSEIWDPAIWSRKMLESWFDEGCPLDVDQAREVAASVKSAGKGPDLMPEALEREILRVIDRAQRGISL